MDLLARLEAPQNALAILTAMITPAVLISACGALIFSTSSRLGRVVDRVRALSEKFELIAKHPENDEMFEERRALIFSQLDRLTSRARLIQRAMAAFYSALGVFVKILARLRGHQALRRPQQQPGADAFFQLGDHFGKCGLSDTQLSRGTRE